MAKKTNIKEESLPSEGSAGNTPVESPSSVGVSSSSESPVRSDYQRDEYADLLSSFKDTIKDGIESSQETAPGRNIEWGNLCLGSRYALIVETDERGIPSITVSRTDTDPSGKSRKQRFYLGVRAEISTKSKSVSSADLANNDTFVKLFDINSSSFELTKRSMEAAQTEGMKVQRKLDEESDPWYDRYTAPPLETSINWDDGADISLNMITDLIVRARQIIKQKLGSRVKEARVAFYKAVDTAVYADSSGTSFDYTHPRVAFTILVKTKEGNYAFKSIRGVGATIDVLKRDLKDGEEKSVKDIIEGMAEAVVKEAQEIDRAQASIRDNECIVVLSGDAAGTFGHECLGHPSEADIVLENKHSSSSEVDLKARLGSQVFENQKFTLVDVGTQEYNLGKFKVKNAWGAIPVDEHGTLPKETIIVEKGIQKHMMTNRYTINELADGLPDEVRAEILKEGMTGNVRSEVFSKEPIVRMTNTYIMPDDTSGFNSVEDLAAKVPSNKTGLYVHSCSGGWVEPSTGTFQLECHLGYLIQNSKIVWSKPVKNVKVLGNISKMRSRIKYIGSSETVQVSTGFCGKDSQYVPVDTGGPALYLEDMNINPISKISWFNMYQEYLDQTNQVLTGTRRPEAIFYSWVDDMLDSGHKDIKHSDVCMFSHMFPEMNQELDLIKGTYSKTLSQYSVINGKLTKKKTIY